LDENIVTSLINPHPGKVLREDFLKELKISAYRLSKDLGIPQTRISEIVKGRRSITTDTALRLGRYFSNSPRFWLGLQTDFDLEEETKALQKELDAIPQVIHCED
jgi:antitoxin HigA-1